MRKQKISKKSIRKEEKFDSEIKFEKNKRKIPWIFGKWLRKPKIKFPKIKFRRLSLPLPPRSISFIIALTILFLLQTGIIYLILREPYSMGLDSQGNPEFILNNNIYEAYVIESIVASILMILFSTGFLLLYDASKYVYNKKLADQILIIGILMIIITFTILQFILNIKAPKLID